MVPEHLEEVKAQREHQVQRVREAVRERLNKEITPWDGRLGELWDESARNPNLRLNIDNITRRREDLEARLERRMRELDREVHLMPEPPNVVGAALIIPAGMSPEADGNAPGTFARDLEAIRRVEGLAMRAVMEAERALGNEPRDVLGENCGYDIESRDGETDSLRMIEVKGRVKGAATVTVTRNEIHAALNKPDDFIFAIVEIEGESAGEPRYVRRPFDREPAFDDVSVNKDLKKLLDRSKSPGG